MRDWYWRVVAAAAVVVAAAYVFGVCRVFAPRPVDAVGGDIIALAPGNTNSYALYVIDVSRKVLLVYNSRGAGRGSTLSSFRLIYGRNMEADAVLAQEGQEIKFNPNGYSVRDVMKALRKLRPVP